MIQNHCSGATNANMRFKWTQKEPPSMASRHGTKCHRIYFVFYFSDIGNLPSRRVSPHGLHLHCRGLKLKDYPEWGWERNSLHCSSALSHSLCILKLLQCSESGKGRYRFWALFTYSLFLAYTNLDKILQLAPSLEAFEINFAQWQSEEDGTFSQL